MNRTPPYDAKVALKRFGKRGVVRLPQEALNQIGVAMCECQESFLYDVTGNFERRRVGEVALYGHPEDLRNLFKKLYDYYTQAVGAARVARATGKKRFVTRSIVIPATKKARSK